MENAGLFRRLAHAEAGMLRGAMPLTTAADAKALAANRAVRAVVATRNGARLVKPLMVSVAERIVANG